MNFNKSRGIVNRIYDEANTALWAASLALVLYFAVFIVPNLPEVRARAERQRIQEITAENDFYCAKWGMAAETQAHPQCILDLQAFRAKIERRIADESDF